MTDFDIDNGEELQPYKNYNYDLIDKEYPIEKNTPSSTYNQFIQLRDTLVYSGNKYNGKGGYKLCIGEKEETVEVLEPQTFKMSFEPATSGPLTETVHSRGTYVEDYHTSPYGILTVKIAKTGWYRIEHKEEILLRPGDNKVFCYVAHFPVQPDGTYPPESSANKIAVFDWQGQYSKSYSLGEAGSFTISFGLGDIIQKMTAYGVIETNLNKGDILTLRCYNSDTQPNRLVFQAQSNRLQIQYIDLPLNN